MPRRLVRDAHGGVGLVDVLAARAGRAVGVDLQVVVLDLDVAGLLDDRRDLDARERRLAAVGGVERRQAHEPVHALLGGVEAVGVLAARAERGGLDARLLPRGGLQQLDLEAAPLGPAHHHPQHHLGPVLGVGAARAGVDGHERVAGVVLAGEQALLLERGEARLDGGERLLELGRELRVLVGELDEPLEVLGVALQLRERVELALRARVLRAGLGRGVGVVPEAGRPHLGLERAQAPLERSGVKDSPRAGTLARGWRPAAGAWAGTRTERPWR